MLLPRKQKVNGCKGRVEARKTTHRYHALLYEVARRRQSSEPHLPTTWLPSFLITSPAHPQAGSEGRVSR